MEDLIGDAKPSADDWFEHRSGSKVFVNRQLETNPIPVIRTSNAIGNIDAAILRRMSFVLRLDLPSRRTAERMLNRVATDERIMPGEHFGTLLDAAPETATVLRVAAHAGRLAGEADGGARPAEALVRGLRVGELPPGRNDRLDLALFESDRPIAPLLDRLARNTATAVSLLLTGPPARARPRWRITSPARSIAR